MFKGVVISSQVNQFFKNHRRLTIAVALALATLCTFFLNDPSRAHAQPQRLGWQIDLKPDLDVRLISNTIGDQGETVYAKEGMTFVRIPLHYDLSVGQQSFSKAIVRGKARRGYYGIQILDGPVTIQRLLALNEHPIYESAHLRFKEDERPQIVAVNDYKSRRRENNNSARKRIQRQVVNLPASGWLLLIVEVPTKEKSLSLLLGKGAVETLDLRYLREANKPLVNPKGSDFKTRLLSKTLAKLERSTGGMAELAIERLTRSRNRLPPNQLDSWSQFVESKIITAGARKENQVRSAAWSYFASRPHIRGPAIDFLLRSRPRILSSWVELIAAHIRESDNIQRAMSSQLLGAILRSNNKAICTQALEVVISLGNKIDRNILADASITAQRLALDRMHVLPQEKNTRLLRMLVKRARPETADKLAVLSRKVKLRLYDPRDRAITQWSALRRIQEKLAVLTILKAVDLGDLIYSQSFGTIMAESIGRGADPKLRESAYSMLIDHVRRRLDELSRDYGDRPACTAFPVLLNADSTDSLTEQLIDAASHGPASIRLDAISLLLRMGYHREAEKSLLTSEIHGGDGLLSALKQLIARPDLAECDALFALLGKFLNRDHAALAEPLLSHLDAVSTKQSVPRWRLCAAMKAGADILKIDELAQTLKPPWSNAAVKWLYALGHLTAQERQRLAASRDLGKRLKRLRNINLRRTLLVDGRYGVLAIIEFSQFDADTNQGDNPASIDAIRRWHVPHRTSVVLPSLTLMADERGHRYSVLWNGQKIGEGVSRIFANTPNLHIRGPDTFSPILVIPEPMYLGPTGWGWPGSMSDDSDFASAIGPPLFPGNRRPLKKSSSDTMTLEITDLLRSALRDAAWIGRQDVESLVPPSLTITLRYASFASYYGVGARLPYPKGEIALGTKHLLNVMLVMEKMDDSHATSPE